jgi:hypothetical protein
MTGAEGNRQYRQERQGLSQPIYNLEWCGWSLAAKPRAFLTSYRRELL